MTVKELIELLSKHDQTLEVTFSIHSEQQLLEADDIRVEEFCYSRPDGLVHNKRPDKPFKKYLSFSGN